MLLLAVRNNNPGGLGKKNLGVREFFVRNVVTPLKEKQETKKDTTLTFVIVFEPAEVPITSFRQEKGFLHENVKDEKEMVHTFL